MSGCLSIEVVEDFLDQRLDATASAEVAQHLSGCATCSELCVALASDRVLVGELKEHLASGPGRASAPARPSIPGYEIGDEIHRGGQGVVYAATQASTGRPAAVKVLLSGPRATRQERDRFEREVSLAASLRHPGIVTVFDGGATAEGWNWLTMELVDGEPLHRFLEAARPSRAASLALFREICDAVQHAHLKGVIHRDLKPGNVLVDRAGHPRVLDFGLAKQIVPSGDASLGNTASGEFVGTLHWAAPEQLQGDPHSIDVRTDVHALGLLLYRLLTGEHPWPKDLSLADLLRAIAEVDPPRPSSRAPGVDPDLDAITLKALAKEPDRRYASAGELLHDLDRHLRGEPVEARGRDSWYVFHKAVRRHRVLVTAAVVTFVGLAAATVVSLVYRDEAERSLVSATNAGRAADRSAEEARKSAETATKAAADATSEAEKSAEVVSFMRKALESGRSLRKGKAMTMADFLDDAARDLESNLPRNPRAEAILRTSLGVTYQKLGLSEKAIDQLRKGVALHEKVGGQDDRERLEGSIELARALMGLRFRFASEVPVVLDDVIARATKSFGATDPLVASARVERALALSAVGKNKAALAMGQEIASELDQRGETESPTRARATQLMAAALVTLGRFPEAETAIEDGLEHRIDEGDRVTLLFFRAEIMSRQGRIGEAIESGESAQALAQSIYLEDQPALVQVRIVLGRAYYQASRFADCAAIYKKVLDSNGRAPAIEPTEVQVCHFLRGWALHMLGNSAEAETHLREAVALSKKAGGSGAPGSRNSRRLLAWLLVDNSRFQEAAPLVRELARANPAVLTAENVEAITLTDLLARIAVFEDSLEEAASLYSRISSLDFNPVPGLSRADILDRYSAVLRRLDRPSDADALAEEARSLRAAKQ